MLYGKENKESVLQDAYNRLRGDMQMRAGENAYRNDLAASRPSQQLDNLATQAQGLKTQRLHELAMKVQRLQKSGAQLDPAMAGEIYDTLAPVLRAEGRR